ncbi:MAG TPA: cytochrome c [Thermoanaerobaculia bacterium]|nr:cytochrome c [Thermoanaerobaculia bacterium]
MKSRSIVTVALVVFALSIPAFGASDGAALFKAKCVACHSADGSGQSAMGKTMKVRDLRSDEVQKQTDLQLTKTISGGKGKMPAFGKQMSTPDIQALIAHIRMLKGK